MTDTPELETVENSTPEKIAIPKVGDSFLALVKPWGSMVKLANVEDADTMLTPGDFLATVEVKKVQTARLLIEDYTGEEAETPGVST